MSKQTNQILIILFISFATIFHSPILQVFNKIEVFGGVPGLLFLILILWLSIIVLLWYLTSRKADNNDHGS